MKQRTKRLAAVGTWRRRAALRKRLPQTANAIRRLLYLPASSVPQSPSQFSMHEHLPITEDIDHCVQAKRARAYGQHLDSFI